MNGWTIGGLRATLQDPSLVPVCRIGGLLRNEGRWSAAAFPMRLEGGDVALVTAAHLLDGATTSDLVAVGNTLAVDYLDRHIRIDGWCLWPNVDVAAVVVPADATKPWRLWQQGFASAIPPSAGILDQSNLDIIAFPWPGHSGSKVRWLAQVVSGVEWLERPAGEPVEYLIEADPTGFDAGSAVFVGSSAGMAFAGLVTSAVHGDGHAQVAVVAAAAIDDLLQAQRYQGGKPDSTISAL